MGCDCVLIDKLVGALLSCEVVDTSSYEETNMSCGSCGREHDIARFGAVPPETYGTVRRTLHSAGCALDMALTAAGLPDQASRDAERKARHGR